ncbi:hypothetical protein ACHAWF_013308, partial [Thalassiosira exigua]
MGVLAVSGDSAAFRMNRNLAGTVAAIVCAAAASVVAIPYDVRVRSAAFLPRGGGGDGRFGADVSGTDVSVEGEEADEDFLGRGLFGVIDLRPNPARDGIFLARETSPAGDDEGGSNLDVVGRALYPPAYGREGSDGEETMTPEEEDAVMSQQAAISHTIGELCPSVYLIVAYDFDGGKTALHRSLGGAKLMSFVDGVRSRMHQMGGAAVECSGDESATRLILILVPKSTSPKPLLLSTRLPSASTEKDTSNETQRPLNRMVLDLTNDG